MSAMGNSPVTLVISESSEVTVDDFSPCEAPEVSRSIRLRCANREDVIRVPARLEELLPSDHLARWVWEVLRRLDLRVLRGHRGRGGRARSASHGSADPDCGVGLCHA
jgi:hypothetical protein